MKTEASTTEASTGEPADAESLPILDGATDIDQGAGTGDAARAADNISQWTSYLPPDCIKAMIAMGWDRTT
jgi:hypothetical protein